MYSATKCPPIFTHPRTRAFFLFFLVILTVLVCELPAVETVSYEIYVLITVKFYCCCVLWSPPAYLHVVGMLRFMSDINSPSSPTPFYSVIMSISVLMALSTVISFHNFSRQLSRFLTLFFRSFSALLVLSTLYDVSLYESLFQP